MATDSEPQLLAQALPTLPEHGPLVKVIVREHGPINEAWRSSSDGLAGAETHLDLEKVDKATPSFGCAFGLGLGGAIALVALGLLAYWRLK